MKFGSCIFALITLIAFSTHPVLADASDVKVDQQQLSAKEVSPEKHWGTSLFDGQKLIEELKKGGYVIYLRHTATEQKIEQWDDIDLQDCTTQRNLSELGRQQGRQIGAAFSSLGIKISKVLTSPYCRCVETATIAFGTAEISYDLLFSVGRNEELEVALGVMLGNRPLVGSNTVLVSHSSNLRDAAGIVPNPEGAAIIFKPQEDGSFLYVATVLPEGWDYFLNEN